MKVYQLTYNILKVKLFLYLHIIKRSKNYVPIPEKEFIYRLLTSGSSRKTKFGVGIMYVYKMKIKLKKFNLVLESMTV